MVRQVNERPHRPDLKLVEFTREKNRLWGKGWKGKMKGKVHRMAYLRKETGLVRHVISWVDIGFGISCH